MSVRCKLSTSCLISYFFECSRGTGCWPVCSFACAEVSPATSNTRRHAAVDASAFPAGQRCEQTLGLDQLCRVQSVAHSCCSANVNLPPYGGHWLDRGPPFSSQAGPRYLGAQHGPLVTPQTTFTPSSQAQRPVPETLNIQINLCGGEGQAG